MEKQKELLKKAHDLYLKGTKFMCLNDDKEYISSGEFMSDKYLENIWDINTGGFVFFDKQWAKVIPQQSNKVIMEKLSLKEIAPYLPYGLKVRDLLQEEKLSVIDLKYVVTAYIGIEGWEDDELKRWKPILRPLPDLKKEIDVNGEKFIPIDWLKRELIKIDGNSGGFDYVGIDNRFHTFYFYDEYPSTLALPYHIIEKFFEWHIDVFNLISRGLAIDINNLK